MKKTKILKKNYEFSKIFSKGMYYSGKTVEAFILKNNSSNFNYLGLAVSVKAGHAYQRNRVRRLLRENYRLIEKDLKCGYSIVFLWKKSIDIKNADFYQIKEDILKILKKANILIEK